MNHLTRNMAWGSPVRWMAVGLCLLVFLMLGGCVKKNTGNTSTIEDLRVGNCTKAKQHVVEENSDELLQALGQGSVNFLCGDYKQSLTPLLSARKKGEERYTRHLSDTALDLIGISKPYPGTAQELPYIDYYRSLAYLSQVNQAKDDYQRQDLIDASVVEVRNLKVALKEMEVKRFYREQDGANQNPIVSVLANIFSAIYNYDMKPAEPLTGDNAWLHYFSGLMYEMKGELDNARINYKKATDLFIKTYYRNYGKQRTQLSINEARQDAVTLLRQEKRSESEIKKILRRNSLPASRKGEHQLAVIQNAGLTAPMGELNLILTVAPSIKSLVLAPVPIGDVRQREDQLRWFSLMSAYKNEKQSFLVLKQQQSRGVLDKVRMIPLIGVWDQAQKLGIIKGIGYGLKLSIPYYSLRDSNLGLSTLYVDGKKAGELVTMEPVSDVAIQEQLRGSNNELFETLVKQVFKAAGGNALVEGKDKQKDDNPFNFGNIFANLTMSADTRKWQFLPEQIRLARVAISPGAHKLYVETRLVNGGSIKSPEISFDVRGRLTVIPVNTLTSATTVNRKTAPQKKARTGGFLKSLGAAAKDDGAGNGKKGKKPPRFLQGIF